MILADIVSYSIFLGLVSACAFLLIFYGIFFFLSAIARHSLHVVHQVGVLVHDPLQVLVVEGEALREFEKSCSALHLGVEL